MTFFVQPYLLKKEKNLFVTYILINFARTKYFDAMETKLTLRLSERVIARAKVYARSQKISLSKIIESYLDSITNEQKSKDIEITPLVKSLSGVIDLPKDFNDKNDYRDYLTQKYK
jgi:ADP-dependent phosphofructokinase/glucokinase